MVRKKKNYGICNSCEFFNYNIENPGCSQDIDNKKHNSKTKKCKKYKLKAEFIERIISIKKNYNLTEENIDNLAIEFQGSSNSKFIKQNQIWKKIYKNEIIQTYKIIISQMFQPEIQKKFKNSNKKKIVIFSLDIETTNWIPSAQEGYINHITQTKLEYNKKQNTISLKTFQIINMNRKPENVKFMLKKIWKFMNSDEENSVDPKKTLKIQLVFNKAFDIRIIERCNKKFGLNYSFPQTIIDLMKSKKSLKNLEDWLNKKIGFERKITEKGNYTKYYSQFKKKHIEPISTYNIIDTLTPLLAYLVLKNIDF